MESAAIMRAVEVVRRSGLALRAVAACKAFFLPDWGGVGLSQLSLALGA